MYEYRAELIRVVDGDTVDLQVDLGFNVHIRERFRLLGINAPEVRGPERPDGIKATDHLIQLLGNRELTIRTNKDSKGKYGRWLATIFVGTQDINAQMVIDGHAVEADY